MSIIQVFIYIFSIVAGYVIGRLGHIWGGSLTAPHHWIYGLLLMIIGLFFERKKWGNPMLFFGLGLFVSDANDFLHFRVYGVDAVQKYTFLNFN